MLVLLRYMIVFNSKQTLYSDCAHTTVMIHDHT